MRRAVEEGRRLLSFRSVKEHRHDPAKDLGPAVAPAPSHTPSGCHFRDAWDANQRRGDICNAASWNVDRRRAIRIAARNRCRGKTALRISSGFRCMPCLVP